MDVESDFVRAWKATRTLPHAARLIAFVQHDFTRQLAEADSKSRTTGFLPFTVISHGRVVALNKVTRTGIVKASDGERVFSLRDQSADDLAVGQMVTFYVSSEFKACVALGVTSATKAGRVMSRSRAVALAKMKVRLKKDLSFGRVETNRLEAGPFDGLSVSKH
jgi:hypothetical protein